MNTYFNLGNLAKCSIIFSMLSNCLYINLMLVLKLQINIGCL